MDFTLITRFIRCAYQLSHARSLDYIEAEFSNFVCDFPAYILTCRDGTSWHHGGCYMASFQ
jgi:hypothetical protein